MADSYCSFPDCLEEAKRYGLCWGHAKQRQRGRELTPLAQAMSPKEAFLEAALAWVEAEGDAEYDQAEARVMRSGEAWMRSRGWRPPVTPRGARPTCVFVQLVLPLKACPPRRVHGRAYATA